MRTRRPSRSRTALVALLPLCATWAAFAACRAADPRGDLRAGVQKVVAEPERRAALIALADDRDAALDEFRLERADLLTRLRAANASYDTSDEAFEELLREFEPHWEALRERGLTDVLEMRALVSPEEWRELAERDVESILADPSGTH